MDTSDAIKAIKAHAMDSYNKHGHPISVNDALDRIDHMLEKAHTTIADEVDTVSNITATRRIAQIGGICHNWLIKTESDYADVTLVIDTAAAPPTADEMQNPETSHA